MAEAHSSEPRNHRQVPPASRYHLLITHLNRLCGRLLHTSPRWRQFEGLDSPLLLALLPRGPVQDSHQKICTEGFPPCRANLQGGQVA